MFLKAVNTGKLRARLKAEVPLNPRRISLQQLYAYNMRAFLIFIPHAERDGHNGEHGGLHVTAALAERPTDLGRTSSLIDTNAPPGIGPGVRKVHVQYAFVQRCVEVLLVRQASAAIFVLPARFALECRI